MSTVRWKDAPTRTVDVGGVEFAYRDLATASDVPVVFLHHFTAVLDDWDPRVIDGIAAHHRVIAFDNRGVGASGGKVPRTVEEMGADAIANLKATLTFKDSRNTCSSPAHRRPSGRPRTTSPGSRSGRRAVTSASRCRPGSPR